VDIVSWSKGIDVTARPWIAGLLAVPIGSAVHAIKTKFANSESLLVQMRGAVGGVEPSNRISPQVIDPFF
jgi:hypothetical protein